MTDHVYRGEKALYEYLRPHPKHYTPLVELPAELNPFLETHAIHLFIKLLNTLPLANVKSLPAWNMYERAGRSLEGTHVVESSSGNTVFSLGILAGQFGIDHVTAIASRDVSAGKLQLLRLAGVDVQLVDGPLCPSPHDPKSSIAVAKKLGEQPGWYNPGQYDNTANPDAHAAYTGPQIYEQLGGEVGLFVGGLGTTGTLVGTANYLRSKNPATRVGGVVRVPNNLVPGVRTKNGLDEVAFDWKNSLTEPLVSVNEKDSYSHSLALIRHGLLVGPSTGFAYAGAVKLLESLRKKGDIECLRGQNVVFVAPDSMFPYVSEYFEVLDSSLFGRIDDQTSGTSYEEATHEIADIPELSVDDIRDDYETAGENLKARHYMLVDIRDSADYADHHVPDSINIPYDKLDEWLAKDEAEKPLVFICRRGSTSLRATQLALQRGVSAYSMIGGTAEWSDRGYPRVKAPYC